MTLIRLDGETAEKLLGETMMGKKKGIGKNSELYGVTNVYFLRTT